MAKFVPGPVIATISGSQGGTVFSRNRSGAYTRNRSVPVTSTTPYALAAKARLGYQSAAWQALTAAQRTAWNSFADASPVVDSLGQLQNNTGHVTFVGINARLALAGETTIDDPPLATDPAPLLTLSQSCDIGLGNFELVYTVTPLAATEQLWLNTAVVMSAGINYVSHLLRHCGESAGAQASPFDHQSLVEARLGTLAVGHIVHSFVRVFDSATGLLSQPLRVTTAVVST